MGGGGGLEGLEFTPHLKRVAKEWVSEVSVGKLVCRSVSHSVVEPVRYLITIHLCQSK